MDKQVAISCFLVNSLYELLKQWHQYASLEKSVMSAERARVLKEDTEKILKMYEESLPEKK